MQLEQSVTSLLCKVLLHLTTKVLCYFEKTLLGMALLFSIALEGDCSNLLMHKVLTRVLPSERNTILQEFQQLGPLFAECHNLKNMPKTFTGVCCAICTESNPGVWKSAFINCSVSLYIFEALRHLDGVPVPYIEKWIGHLSIETVELTTLGSVEKGMMIVVVPVELFNELIDNKDILIELMDSPSGYTGIVLIAKHGKVMGAPHENVGTVVSTWILDTMAHPGHATPRFCLQMYKCLQEGFGSRPSAASHDINQYIGERVSDIACPSTLR